MNEEFSDFGKVEGMNNSQNQIDHMNEEFLEKDGWNQLDIPKIRQVK